MLAKTNLLFQDMQAASLAKGTSTSSLRCLCCSSFLSIQVIICNRYLVCIHVPPLCFAAAAPLYFPSDCKPVKLDSTLLSGSETFISSAPVPPSAPRLHTPTSPANSYNPADAARKARERDDTWAVIAASPAAPSLNRPPNASPRFIHVAAARDTAPSSAVAEVPATSDSAQVVLQPAAAAGEEVSSTLLHNFAILQRCGYFICCSGWLQRLFSRHFPIGA